MNRMVFMVMLGLLCLCIFPPAIGAPPKDKNCVPDEGCPEGEFPPKCCQPPPCEFWDALEQARARERIITSRRLMLAADESTETDFSQFMKTVNDEFKKIRQQHPKCPKKSKLGNTPVFSVVPDYGDCKVSTQVNKAFQQLDLSDVLKTTTACDELVTARYEAAAVSEAYCAMQSDSPFDRAQEQFQKAQREKSVLEDQLIHYFGVCTIVEDSEIAQTVTGNSVDKLKKITAKNQWTKQKAKRAAKARKSR